jgi:hypothetical protein
LRNAECETPNFCCEHFTWFIVNFSNILTVLVMCYTHTEKPVWYEIWFKHITRMLICYIFSALIRFIKNFSMFHIPCIN